MKTPFRNTLLGGTALFVLSQSAHAALMLNMGPSTTTGQGPSGADAAWQAYTTPHEQATNGQLTTYNGTTFSGVVGSYNVGVAFSWGGAGNAAKQSISRGTFNNFYNNWMGTDSREAGPDTMTITLTGLPTSTSFVLTSYHFDTFDQRGKFTTSVTGSQEFNIGAGGDTKENFIYDFSIVSDGSGTATIDYTQVASGTLTQQFFVMNGFELSAIPEPSAALLGSFGMFFLLRRRR